MSNIAAAVRVVTGSSSRLSGRLRQTKAILTMTDAAAGRLNYLLSNYGPGSSSPSSDLRPKRLVGIRLGLKTKGCNGFAYTLEYAEKQDASDEVVDEKGVKLLVSPKALMSVIGTEMDYVESDLKSEFVFTNPNATATCGCGESFSLGDTNTGTNGHKS